MTGSSVVNNLPCMVRDTKAVTNV